MEACVCVKNSMTPCREACPAGVDVPRYVRYIREGQFDEALAVIRESLPLPAVCGYACVHPCEAHCARAQYDQPVAIRMLKRAAVEKGNGLWKENLPHTAATGKKIAIVGAGPCGLTAAYYLSGKGHRAVIHEARPEAGGMLRYGIPAYRLPKDELAGEIAEIIARGVEIRTNSRVASAAALLREGYDAVFVATGAWRSAELEVEGAGADILDGMAYLQQINSGQPATVGSRVVVIGGGNTAIDAARTSVRLGAREVTIIYRRTRDQMPADAEEIAGATEEGVNIIYLAAPVKLAAGEITCVKMKLGAKDAGGRPAPVPVPGSEFTIACDTVIAAIGQKADALALGLESSPDGAIKVDQNTQSTGIPGIFAAGDAVTGPSSIIQAVAQGKQAASAIDCYLGGDGVIKETLAPAAEPGPAGFMPMGAERAATRTIAYDRRLNGFAAVEKGYTDMVAMREARRCLGCDQRTYRVEVDYDACKQCGYCAEVCGLGIFQPAEGFNDRGYKPMRAAGADKCVGCYKCFFVCPDWAINIQKVGGAEQ